MNGLSPASVVSIVMSILALLGVFIRWRRDRDLLNIQQNNKNITALQQQVVDLTQRALSLEARIEELRVERHQLAGENHALKLIVELQTREIKELRDQGIELQVKVEDCCRQLSSRRDSNRSNDALPNC